MNFSRDNFELVLEQQTALSAENDQLKTENKFLQQKVQFLLNKLFGRSSEKLNPDQLEMLIDELNEAQDALDQVEEEIGPDDEPVNSRRGKRKPLKERIPEDLPVERVVIVPDEVKACPEAYKKIGEETLEELDVTPTHYFVRIIVREKYVPVENREAPPVIEPAPAKLVPGSYASDGLILSIILAKYCDHLPLYRQEMILKLRYGIEISRKTMGNWMYLIADWLTLIYEALRNEIRQSEYIQADVEA